MPKSYKVTTDNLRPEMAEVWRIVSKGVLSAPVVVTLDREGQTRLQQEKYQAMCNDIARQMTYGEKCLGGDVWFAALFDQFEQDLKEQGRSLNKPRNIVKSLDGLRWVSVRSTTALGKGLRKSEAAEFIEFLFCFGAQNKIVWSDDLTSSLAEAYGQQKT
jgi:hypothetical protein